MKSEEIRKKFIEYFESKGHKNVPSSSLVPDDPSVLFTTAGMQQFKRYFTGELNAQKDFGSLNTVSIQKCFRTSDIDSVGDESHLTFFEMLGNFSFGGYWKKEAIQYAYEFITDKEKGMGLTIDYVTYFDPKEVSEGDWRKGVPKDEESLKIWQSLGVKNIRPEGVDVFWGPTGNEGPCGPTTEVYVNGLEVWNIVFNEYYRDSQNKLIPLKTKGIDTGMGFERLVMVSQGVKNVYETDLFTEIQKDTHGKEVLPKEFSLQQKRIILDHLRGIAFLIADGVRPSNKESDYVLRRLLRRITAYEFLLNNPSLEFEPILHAICKKYGTFYPELNDQIIVPVYEDENSKFLKTIHSGLNEMSHCALIDAKIAFKLYESFGLPYEIVKDLGGIKTESLTREAFDAEFLKHQEISRAGAEKKFGGHGLLLDTGELKAKDEIDLKKVVALHTATHLLHQALREVLGEEASQRGSDITPERARFDFSFPRKMVPEEIKKTEQIINEKIKADLPVTFKEMKKEDAQKTGALHFFNGKYPEIVKVYFVSPDNTLENAWSKEFCNGPHITHTGEIGSIKIIKEEASSAGVRRIRITFGG